MTNIARNARQFGAPNGPAGIPSAPIVGMHTNNFFGLLPKEYAGRKKEFFTYNVRFNTIAASGTATVTANVQNDSDFVWVQGAVIATAANFTTFTNQANVTFQPIPMLVTLSDSAAGVLLQDSPTHINNLFGDIRNPFTLPFPKIFRKGGQISVQLQNQDAGNAYVVNLAFHGFKVYYMANE